jgi:hypothetical protein
MREGRGVGTNEEGESKVPNWKLVMRVRIVPGMKVVVRSMNWRGSMMW